MRHSFMTLALAALLVAGCSPKNSPTGSGSNSGGGGFNVGSGLVRIVVAAAAGSAENASAEIVGPGGPVANAAITMSSNDLTAPLIYTGNNSLAVLYNGGSSFVTAGTYSIGAGPWTYTVGSVYTFTAKFGGTTYSASVTATDSPAITTHTGYFVASWAQPGNSSIIQCADISNASDYKDYGPVGPVSSSSIPGLSSPTTVQNSALPGYTAGNYLINSQNNNLNLTFAPSGLNSSNSFVSWSSVTAVSY